MCCAVLRPTCSVIRTSIVAGTADGSTTGGGVRAESAREAEVRRRKKRVEAAELEARAERIMMNCAVMEAEAMRLNAYAAALRRESDG